MSPNQDLDPEVECQMQMTFQEKKEIITEKIETEAEVGQERFPGEI